MGGNEGIEESGGKQERRVKLRIAILGDADAWEKACVLQIQGCARKKAVAQ